MASLKFDNVYIKDYFTLVGPKEKESKINNFDISINDYYYKTKTFEMAEIKMQRVVIESLINNNNMCDRNFDYLIGGDLINQISISSYSAKEFRIPYIGVYSACATFVEEMLLASNLIQSKNAKNIICITSSHNLTAERQFRYPNEYGNSKPSTATSTATCAVGSILTNEKHSLKITSGTIGKVVDLGINDVNHMGAVMAPAAGDVIYNHLKDTKRDASYYDLILSGDLGIYGKEILKDYMMTKYNIDISNNYNDCGTMLYDVDRQPVFAGGSGPVCSSLVNFGYIYKEMLKGKFKKVLIVPTGAVFSPTFTFQKESIPGIANAISLEVQQ